MKYAMSKTGAETEPCSSAVCCRKLADMPLFSRCYLPLFWAKYHGDSDSCRGQLRKSRKQRRRDWRLRGGGSAPGIGIQHWVGWLQIRCICSQSAARYGNSGEHAGLYFPCRCRCDRCRLSLSPWAPSAP